MEDGSRKLEMNAYSVQTVLDTRSEGRLEDKHAHMELCINTEPDTRMRTASKISVHRSGLVVTQAVVPFALRCLSRRQNHQNEILTQRKDMLALVLLLCLRWFACALLVFLVDELVLGSWFALDEHSLVSSNRFTALSLYGVALVGVLKKGRGAMIAG